MTTTDAVLLGLVQGLTEFLPVSSTAHLLIAQHLLGVREENLHLEVAAHLGTIASVVLYYRRELAATVRETLAGGAGRKLGGMIVLASLPLPLVLVVYRLWPAVKAWRKDVHVAALGLVVIGLFLLGTRFAKRREGDAQGSWLDALSMGFAQCVAAIVPGCSRSGSTIGTALFRGTAPEWAARFTFLMSIPAILGAALADAKEEPWGPGDDVVALGLVAFVAFASGIAAIHMLLKVVGRGRLAWFGAYCLAAGVAVRTLL